MNLELLTDETLLALLEDAVATPCDNLFVMRNLICELCRRYRLVLGARREEVIQDGN